MVDHLTIDDKTTNINNTKEIDDILSAISNLPQEDLENFNLDEPNTWNKAKSSSYSEQWEIEYKEELQSLKDMGVYKLLHRSQVSAGAKIRKGRPVFCLKMANPFDGKYAWYSKGLNRYTERTIRAQPHLWCAWSHGGFHCI